MRVRAIVLGLVVVMLAGCGPSYPSCERDPQCHDGEHCTNARCQECGEDEHCAPGQRCAAGSCVLIPGWCGSDRGCPDGEVCVDSECQPG